MMSESPFLDTAVHEVRQAARLAEVPAARALVWVTGYRRSPRDGIGRLWVESVQSLPHASKPSLQPPFHWIGRPRNAISARDIPADHSARPQADCICAELLRLVFLCASPSP